ncbi:MAG: 50S ribosomal protein L25, partial [Candidatus Latescibacteria bacterium]|nr:50S ribosomal protein L25 [Candidatus Latescibacterota bacterium]
KVIIRKVQLHPVTQEYLNVDLQHVSMKTKVTVEIPIVIEGTAKGTKEGGILEHVLHALKIECLPSDIPEHIQVDVSELDIGHSVHVEDLEISKARVLTDSTSSVVTILPPVVIVEPVEEVEEELEEAVEGEEKEEEEGEKEESKQEE